MKEVIEENRLIWVHVKRAALWSLQHTFWNDSLKPCAPTIIFLQLYPAPFWKYLFSSRHTLNIGMHKKRISIVDRLCVAKPVINILCASLAYKKLYEFPLLLSDLAISTLHLIGSHKTGHVKTKSVFMARNSDVNRNTMTMVYHKLNGWKDLFEHSLSENRLHLMYGLLCVRATSFELITRWASWCPYECPLHEETKGNLLMPIFQFLVIGLHPSWTTWCLINCLSSRTKCS